MNCRARGRPAPQVCQFQQRSYSFTTLRIASSNSSTG
jgi:hypothetical protein